MERVVTSYHSPRIPIPFNWGTNGTLYVGGNVFPSSGSNTNPFSTFATDPNTNKFPVEYATGKAGIDGNFTVALTGGFTPPLTVTVWEYNRRAFGDGANPWFKLGPNAGNYQITVDATQTILSFQTSESAYVLIQTSAAVTGDAYMDGTNDFQGSVAQSGEGEN